MLPGSLGLHDKEKEGGDGQSGAKWVKNNNKNNLCSPHDFLIFAVANVVLASSFFSFSFF